MIPVTQEIKKPRQNVTLVAPVIPEYKPKVAVIRPPNVPKLIVHNEPKPEFKPIPPKPAEVKPPVLAAAPEIKNTPEPVVRPLPEPKIEAPAPKPEVRTGTFQTAEVAKGPPEVKQVKVGGFGDPNGVRPSDSHANGVMMAKVGAFDMPVGSGTAGGGGKAAAGGVRPTSFGDAGSGVTSSANRGTVHTGGFSDSSIATPANTQRVRPAEPTSTPVEILSKPKPVYTQEARDLKLEGRVSLEVVFLATGQVRIVRVLHGLGHGLDEAAQQAALQVRFKPATKAGVPVDADATINITFELT
ncbi:MAG: TonB family protein [Acidobacteriales bacterium]|nr:TonB family protein [Terriglobales bacterium]